MTFCKCVCFGTNSTILPLYLPKDPAYPCLSCTRQFCLDQKLPACIGAKTIDQDLDTSDGSGGDVEAICFRPSLLTHSLWNLVIHGAIQSATRPRAISWSSCSCP